MISLISIGLLSGLFFSITFILNRIMSLEGGHWLWSASLRYAFMIIILTGFISLLKGFDTIKGLGRLFLNNWKFWTLAGTIGFGGFYSLICFSSDHSPGWVIAATWQLTIIATLVVLMGFGRSFPKKVWLFSIIIFAGVLMVNLSYVQMLSIKELLMGGLPVLIAAFCYPIGNQLVWEAINGNPSLPKIDDPLVVNPFHKVLLLSWGSVPFWIILIAIIRPDLPSHSQIVNTALVAIFSGIIATSLFLMARNRAYKPSQLAAVDATQSSEVIFAIIGEILILNAPLPNSLAIAGICLVFIGLALFILFQEIEKK
ncbi:MAG: multidrug resistance efflux transporter family protein [Desulfobacula sp.]|jgi:drug/metabolite transporter (DMT)-like permease|uniref:DMT family transporter n=1 Tax=Desulfobacula sp. TaxID=2593537 RepID=UPI001D3863C1|nr:multidrug resistance efflux transporter family protein [Desulfobacula sp.]MBT3485786.1 multidrug resistance efflux transporter family protein [Desulfobacula sp.]MBT3803410.1 multidrug resistance efflux transporter family protein [Desulfobacula sp.]MBT4024331.1 multidrug resistance efflux transporter family protein [Desulfobacula sp.]MBT4199642.1 multidrug resistance efflux transporter family protein [Desulfobacula sp.]